MKYKLGDKVFDPEYRDGKILEIDIKKYYCLYRVKFNQGGLKIWMTEEIIDKIIVKDNKMQEITKENIDAVLKHNGVDSRRYIVDYDNIKCFTETETSYVGTTILFKAPEWLQLIEVYFGKLEPLPEPHPFDAVKIGWWIKCLVPDGFTRTEGKWYQRVEPKYLIRPKEFSYIGDNNHTTATDESRLFDLTDIRDYNPDEEIVLKSGDEIILNKLGDKYIIKEIDYFCERIYILDNFAYLYFKQLKDGTIESVNGRRGKFVIPPFDFEKTLLDAGFKYRMFFSEGLTLYYIGEYLCSQLKILHQNNLYTIVSTAYNFEIKPTPQTAKILIELKQLFEQLEVPQNAKS